MAETRNEQPVILLPAELETRLCAMETALHALQCQLATLTPTSHWLEKIIGSCKDHPAFDEVIALGRAFRESQPYPEEWEDGVEQRQTLSMFSPELQTVGASPTPRARP